LQGRRERVRGLPVRERLIEQQLGQQQLIEQQLGQQQLGE
jgi:hypothetical protein